MNRRIDHRQVQSSHVTFANGEWQGTRPMAAEHADESLRTCLLEWDYLRSAGDDGWSLVAVAQGIGGDANARIGVPATRARVATPKRLAYPPGGIPASLPMNCR